MSKIEQTVKEYTAEASKGKSPSKHVCVSDLLSNRHLALTVAAGEAYVDRKINSPELNRPSLELTGFFERFRPERTQILGSGEMAYLSQWESKPRVLENLERIFTYEIPCIVVTNNIEAPPFLCELGLKYKTPILVSPHHTTKLSKRAWEALDAFFSPRTLVHGVLVDVYGIGVLILGRSGVGKSECALELISRGHVLVADDLVEIRCLASSVLMGYVNQTILYHMELRGLGIIDVNRVYGASAIRPSKRIRLVVILETWDEKKEYERLGLEERYCEILEIEIPCLIIPVCPGRNISSIVEVGALQQKLRRMGIEPAKELNEKLIELTRRKHSPL